MSLSDYRFVTRWKIPTTADRVWQELMTPEEWPGWWRGVERVELLQPGSGLGLGALRRYTWKSRLPYRLSFLMQTTRIEPEHLLEGQATGELSGRGCWSLNYSAGITQVEYLWEVTTTKTWMRLFSPIARPVFAWNHNVIMEWGRVGLLQRLNSTTPLS